MASILAKIFGYWDKVSVPAKWASRLEKTEPVRCEKSEHLLVRLLW
jgi:hypothetical protein